MTRAPKKKAAKAAPFRMRPRIARVPPAGVREIEDTFKKESAQWIKKHGEGPAYQAFCVGLHTPLGVGVGEFLSDSLTDGHHDKKVDFCHIDAGRALVVQGYHAQQWGKTQAPANKAEELELAMSWLLHSGSGNMPDVVRSKAEDLQNSIRNGDIARVDLCYVHNCHESDAVRDSLNKVEEAVKRGIKLGRHPIRDVSVHGHEIGLETVRKLLAERDAPFLVGEKIKIPNIGTGIIEERNGEAGWRALVMSVPADWVRKQFKQWGSHLFASNVRDYLGASGAKMDINSKIKQTAASDPRNFWAFNNGITALTRKIIDDNGEEVVIEGISVVNGAQTTGALGGMSEKDLFCDADPASARVLLRVIETGAASKDDSLIKSITRYNNTQNRLYPEDLRSKDPTQIALHEEFEKAKVFYAHRRGELRWRAGATIQSNVVARLLCAFHGDPETALRSYRRIFDEEEQYKNVFPQGLKAAHVFLLDTLAEAYDEMKGGLGRRAIKGEATQMEKERLKFLAYSSAAKHFFFFIVGECSEEILGCRITDKHKWGVRNVSPQDRTKYVRAWTPVVKAILTRLPRLVQRVGESEGFSNPFYSVPRSARLTKDVATRVKEEIENQEGRGLEKIRALTALID